MSTANVHSLDTRAIVDFTDAMEHNDNLSENLFSQDLLYLFRKHFGFEYMSITMLNNGLFFNSCSLFDLDTSTKMGSLRSNYRSFHPNDRLSRYLYEHPGFLEDKGRYTLRAMEVADIRGFLETDYKHFLNRSGFGDIIIMDFFRKNITYRINFFKELDGGSFTEKDVNFLSDVQRLIKLKLRRNEKNRAAYLNNKAKAAFLDGIGTGYLLFDTQGNLMEYNQRAMIYTASLFPRRNLTDIFIDLTSLVANGVQQGDMVIAQQFKGYKIYMSATSIVDDNGQLDTYYFFLLSKQNEIIVSDAKPSFSNLLSKRELEVLDEYCQGKECKDIANQFYISESTVRQHIKNIYQKLKINNQRALVRLYMHDKMG